MIEKSRIEIVKSILAEEIQKNNLNVDFAVSCRIAYYSKEILNKLKNKSLKFSNIKSVFGEMNKWNGLCSSKEIVVFSDESLAYFCEPRPLVQMISVAYHELYHAIQNKEIKNTKQTISYDLFSSICDNVLVHHTDENLNKYNFSAKEHNSPMFEILANLYSVKKTEEYLKHSNIEIKPNEIEFLKNMEKMCKMQYENYDLTKRLNIILSEYKKGIAIGFLKPLVFEMFINDDGTIKDVNTIFSNEIVLGIDPRILLAFIKTDKMKEAIKNTQLTENTTFILNELLTKGSLTIEEENVNNKTI